jgi:hypothetical protein
MVVRGGVAAMRIEGMVKNGVVVMEGPLLPPEGARVQVEFSDPQLPGAWIDEFAGVVRDLPPDASWNVDHHLNGHKKR